SGRVRHPQRAALISLLIHDGDVMMRIRPVDAGKPHPLPPSLGCLHVLTLWADAATVASCSLPPADEESQTIVALAALAAFHAGARSAPFYERWRLRHKDRSKREKDELRRAIASRGASSLSRASSAWAIHTISGVKKEAKPNQLNTLKYRGRVQGT